MSFLCRGNLVVATFRLHVLMCLNGLYFIKKTEIKLRSKSSSKIQYWGTSFIGYLQQWLYSRRIPYKRGSSRRLFVVLFWGPFKRSPRAFTRKHWFHISYLLHIFICITQPTLSSNFKFTCTNLKFYIRFTVTLETPFDLFKREKL